MPSIGDLMVAFSTWIQSTQMPIWALGLQKTGLSMFIAMTPYVIPTLQTVHIFMVGNKSRTLAQTLDRFMPWVWWCLLVLLITGVLMAVGEPPRDLQNPAFWTKMCVVPVTALLTLWFDKSMRRHVVAWDTPRGGPAAVKAASVGFMFLWMVIMVLGRWIAYVPTA